ncbi:MAG: DUF2764 family protein [Prolixibacteraceae bacterium]|nr:DUF2764 family protein [Prolixibacteraceae bacterium]
MFKKKYYCLIAGLPDLFFTELKTGLTPVTFRNTIKNDLLPADFELVKLLFLPADNENLLRLLFQTNEPWNCSGNFSEKFMEGQIENPTLLPDYMTEFLRWTKKKEIREKNLSAETKLESLFYTFVSTLKNSFLQNWFLFDLKSRNLITGFNCLNYKYEINKHLVKTTESKYVNSLLLANRLKPEYYEDEIPYVHDIIRVMETDMEMAEKEKNFDKIRWDYLDEHTFFHYFSIEKILSYILRLQIIERWMKLDKETGEEFLQKMISELQTSYEFPAEFSIAK